MIEVRYKPERKMWLKAKIPIPSVIVILGFLKTKKVLWSRDEC